MMPYQLLARGLAVILPVWCLVAGLELFLWRSGETISMAEIVRREHGGERPCLYLPQYIGEQIRRLQIERLKKHMPKILVLGSSRTERFRKEMFIPNADVLVASHVVRSVGDLEVLLARWPRDEYPSVLLLGVDAWWFSRAADAAVVGGLAADMAEDDTHTPNAHFHAYGQVIRAMFRKQLSFDLLARIVTLRVGGITRFGIRAWSTGGIARDGGRRELDRTTPASYRRLLPCGDLAAVRLRFPEIRAFRPYPELDASLVRHFFHALSELNRRGVQIVGYAPPFASECRDLFNAYPAEFRGYAEFGRRMANEFAQHNWPWMDASVPATLGFDDRALQDIYHPMETFNAALLLRLASTDVRMAGLLGVSVGALRHGLEDSRTTHWYPYYGANP